MKDTIIPLDLRANVNYVFGADKHQLSLLEVRAGRRRDIDDFTVFVNPHTNTIILSTRTPNLEAASNALNKYAEKYCSNVRFNVEPVVVNPSGFEIESSSYNDKKTITSINGPSLTTVLSINGPKLDKSSARSLLKKVSNVYFFKTETCSIVKLSLDNDTITETVVLTVGETYCRRYYDTLLSNLRIFNEKRVMRAADIKKMATNKSVDKVF